MKVRCMHLDGWMDGWMDDKKKSRQESWVCYSEGQRTKLKVIRSTESTGETVDVRKGRCTRKQTQTDRDDGDGRDNTEPDSESWERGSRDGKETGNGKDSLKNEREELALATLGNTLGTVLDPCHNRLPHALRSTVVSLVSPVPQHCHVPRSTAHTSLAPASPSSLLCPPCFLFTVDAHHHQLCPGAAPCTSASSPRGLTRAERAQCLCTSTSLSPGNWTLLVIA